MFQFRRFPSYAYLIQRRMTEYCSAGFPHSVISGSKPICGSPKRIAACHDLHRLLMPRHSPCALISLTSSGQAFCCLLLWSTKSGSQESCRLQSVAANCFYPFVSTICSTLLLALPFWNYHSHCSVFKVRAPTFSKVRSQYSTSVEYGDPLLLSWWAKVDSNHRPHDYQSCALAS